MKNGIILYILVFIQDQLKYYLKINEIETKIILINYKFYIIFS